MVFIFGVLAIMADRSTFGTIARTSKKAARRAAPILLLLGEKVARSAG
jgi:hypothetical protein